MSNLDELLEACADEIDRRVHVAAQERAVLRAGAAAFRAALATSTPIKVEPSTVPVASNVSGLEPSPLVDLVHQASDEIHWTTSTRLDDGGTEAALAVLNQVREFGDVTVGFMLLGPGCEYPEHNHAPQEIYLPIAGNGSWLYGGHVERRSLGPDSLVYNNPNDRHGVIADGSPLLALYILWP